MDGPPAQSRFSPPRKLLLVLVLAITCAVFVPSLSNGFVNWDDNEFVYNNPNVLAFDGAHLKAIFTTPVTGAYCPLVTLTFALEKLAFGFNPGLFHLDNLLLHLVCVFLVYRLLQKLQLSSGAAGFGALLFGIHPMHVESVAWITERKDVLYSAFYFGALVSYLRYIREGTRKLYIITFVLFALSLLSKIQAVTLPLSMLLLDYYLKRPHPAQRVRKKIPFFALAIAVGTLGVLVLAKTDTLNPLGQTTLVGRLVLGIYAFWIYVVKAFIPYRLWPLYRHPTAVWPLFAAVLATIAFIPWLLRAHRNGNRAIVFGFLFFTANIVFMLQILSAGATFLADRYSYIAYFGLFFIAARAFEFIKLRPIIVVAAAIYICGLSALTWRQCAIWESGETLWTFAMRHLPTNPLPYLQRANYYRSQAETAPADSRQLYFTKSLTDFDKAIQLVDAQPDAIKEKVMAHNSRAKTFFDAGQTDSAIADYTQVIALDPSYPEAYVNRAAAYAKLQQSEKALSDLNHALSLQPNNSGALYTRGLVYKDMHKSDLAMKDFNSYLALNPTDEDILVARGVVETDLGKPRDAIEDFNRALQIEPERFATYLNRSRALFLLGKTNEAEQDLKTAQNHGVSTNLENN